MGEKEETHRVRCPDCEYETVTTHKEARSIQKRGCPNCADKRGLGVKKV